MAGARPSTPSVTLGGGSGLAVDAAISAAMKKALFIAQTNEQKEDIEIVARLQLIDSDATPR